jgi:hypothetical protein
MTPRLAMCGGVLVAALTGGCAVEVPFDAAWNLPVAGPPGALALDVPMDLTEQPVWARRDTIGEVRVELVEVKVVAIGARNRAASAVLGLRYRPEGVDSSADLELVLLEPVVLPLEVDATVQVEAPSGLGEAVRELLGGSGRFTLAVEGRAEAPVEATVELSMHGAAVVAP